MHFHIWVQNSRDENPDRIRTRDRCDCGAIRYGCCAKRLDDGEPAWGPVGEWTYSVKTGQAPHWYSNMEPETNP